MHIKVTRKSTEKALRLFYAQEPTLEIPEGETEIPEGESLAEVEEAAYALLRSHVRAIDETEDDLLLIYLEAALDYMEQLTNRILGESDVVVYFNKEELKHTLPISKINDVTRMWKLEYRSKDADDKASYFEPYKLLEAEYENEIFTDAITGLKNSHFEVDSNGEVTSVGISILMDVSETSLATLNVQFQKRNSDGTYSSSDVFTDRTYNQAEINAGGGTLTVTDGTEVIPQGMYRIKAVLDDTNLDENTTNYLYFTANDGTDFDNVIITDRYPCYVDLSNYVKAIGTDASDHEEDFARMHMIAGTDLMAVPKQYKQAALLLIGHYYNQREAENPGGITMEIKEGVHRLLQSVRRF